MDDDDLRDLLSAVRSLIRPHLEGSEPWRRVARHVGRLLSEEAERAGAASDHRTDAQRDDDGPGSASPPHPAPEIEISAELPLTFGGSTVRVPIQGTPEEIARARARLEARAAADGPGGVDDTVDLEVARENAGDGAPPSGDEPAVDALIDLSLIVERCRLKARSCRLFIERRAAEGDPEREPALVCVMDGMIAEAKAMPGCFLWTFLREKEQPPDDDLEAIGRCYDAMADAAVALRLLEDLGARARDDDRREALALAAESNSALRVALDRTWLRSADEDQHGLYHWIRAETTARGIYLARHMRLDDPADPARVDEIDARIAALTADIEAHADGLKQVHQAFTRLRYHVGLLDGADDETREHHCGRIVATIDMLGTLDVAFSDRRFRRLLDEATVQILTAGDMESTFVSNVLESLSVWHAASSAAADDDGEDDDDDDMGTAEVASERVQRVRALLAGRAVVVIGGDARREAADRIREAFELADLTWVRLSEHGTGQPMCAPIARSETCLVLILVKLCGHLHVDEARRRAREAGKPVVMLKAGYNPERIANAVLRQASEQLEATMAME